MAPKPEDAQVREGQLLRNRHLKVAEVDPQALFILENAEWRAFVRLVATCVIGGQE
jgi:hypothetical protein